MLERMKMQWEDLYPGDQAAEERPNAAAPAPDTAATQPPEEEALIRKEEVIKVLERTASDNEFIANLLFRGSDALEEYDLTGPEKLALVTGDVEWIEKHVGRLTPPQKRWLEQRLSAEIW